jgi:alpha-tubulin suppressor-like RCC1 family protein
VLLPRIDASKVFCWGFEDSDGFILSIPKQQEAPNSEETELKSISVGKKHICGVRNDGSAWCEHFGKQVVTMNSPSSDDYSAPGYGQTNPPSRSDFREISAGSRHTCGLTTNSEVVCWGAGETPRPGEKQTPLPSPGGSDKWAHQGQSVVPPGKYDDISTGSLHSCGVRNSGKLVCWGTFSIYGDLPSTGPDFVSVDSGRHSACAMTERGSLKCWGAADGLGKKVQPSANR